MFSPVLSENDPRARWNVPSFIDIVTSAFTCDVGRILKGLSENGNPKDDCGGSGSSNGLYGPLVECAQKEGWQNWPNELHPGEPDKLVSFINEITDGIRGLEMDGHQTPKDLVFADLTRINESTSTPYLRRMPDFALIKRSKSAEPQKLTWSDVYCVGDLDLRNNYLGTAKRLMGFAEDCFLYHHGRRFVLGLGFFGENFAIFVFDRSGAISSQLFNVNQDPLQFLRGVACLPFLDEVDFGIDHSLIYDGFDEHILSKGLKYKVTRELYRNDDVISKGTLCLEVEDEEGKAAVAKDSWPLRTEALREVEILDLIKDMKNVPRVISYENVPVFYPHHSSYDNTAYIRDAIKAVNQELVEVPNSELTSDHDRRREQYEASSIRDHMRLIISPLGQPLRDFKTLPELVSAMLDVIETIDELDKRGIVHGDISHLNIVLVAKDGALFRPGYLIDFEDAIKRGSKYISEKETVTLPFFATGRLVFHEGLRALHDAESVLYVLIFISICNGGPGGIPNEGFNVEVDDWIFSAKLPPNEEFKHEWQGLTRAKFEIMCDDNAFRSEVFDRMHPYFYPLRKLLTDLRDFFLHASFRAGQRDVTHQDSEEREAPVQDTRAQFKMIKDIFRANLAELRGPERTNQKKRKEMHRDSYLLRPRPCPSPLKRPATEQADDGEQEGHRKRYKPRRKSAVQKK